MAVFVWREKRSDLRKQWRVRGRTGRKNWTRAYSFLTEAEARAFASLINERDFGAPKAQRSPAKAKRQRKGTKARHPHTLFIERACRNRWAVRWWPDARAGDRKGRHGSSSSRRFATERSRAAFIDSGFKETGPVVTNRPGRNAGDQEHERSLNPEEWGPMWTATVNELSRMRGRENVPPRQFDVYRAMESLGFLRPEEGVIDGGS